MEAGFTKGDKELIYPAGTELFAGPDTEDVLEMAKKYIVSEGYNSGTVKLLRRDNLTSSPP